MASSYMKEPCDHCPYRRDVQPFLTLERGYELAYLAQNKYSDFHCHKTIDFDDETGEGITTRKSLTCAGFLTLQINESEVRVPEGFSPSVLAYDNTWEMTEAYEDNAIGEWKSPAWLNAQTMKLEG